MEPHFGLGMHPRNFFRNRIVQRDNAIDLPTGYHRSWALALQDDDRKGEYDKSQHFDKDGFQASIDVHHFTPAEISVKAVGNTIFVEGKHGEQTDGFGSIERHFIRKYELPKEYDMANVHSTLSNDGVLTIKAPLPAAIASGKRTIPIAHTNMPAHLSTKINGHSSANRCENAVAKSSAVHK